MQMTTDRERFEQALGDYYHAAQLGAGGVSTRNAVLDLYDAAAAPCQECERLREAGDAMADDIEAGGESLELSKAWRDARAGVPPAPIREAT
jgi:hypothetical protein